MHERPETTESSLARPLGYGYIHIHGHIDHRAAIAQNPRNYIVGDAGCNEGDCHLVSVKYWQAVWQTRLSNGSCKLVALAIADNANEEGLCWPSIEYLASKTELSARAVRYSIKQLAKDGHLTVSERFGRSNIFTLTPANLAAPPLQDLHPTPANGAATPAN
jgi:Helix-turn-helix domain